MKLNQASYLSYILRLWRLEGEEIQERREEELVWRASLDDPETGERIGFADLDTLFEHIRGITKRNG
jgi:hypothetical protein